MVRAELLALMMLAAFVQSSPASQLRFRYAAVDAAGNTNLVPSSPAAKVGERVTWLGTVRRPYVHQPKPTHLVTFRHPSTGRDVTVPMTFPGGTPRIEYRPRRIVYNYGSYTVEAQFFADGTVDVVYDSGLFRGP